MCDLAYLWRRWGSVLWFVELREVQRQLRSSVRHREFVVCERRHYRCRYFCWLTCPRWNRTVSHNVTTTSSQQYVHAARLKSTTTNHWSTVDWCWRAVLKVLPTATDDRGCHTRRHHHQFCCLVMKATETTGLCWQQLDTSGLAEPLQNSACFSFKENVIKSLT